MKETFLKLRDIYVYEGVIRVLNLRPFQKSFYPIAMMVVCLFAIARGFNVLLKLIHRVVDTKHEYTSHSSYPDWTKHS